jgi:hypothetical protein
MCRRSNTVLSDRRPRGSLATGLLAASLLAASARVCADDQNLPGVSFSAFGAFGMVHSSEHRADYVASVFQPNGAGFSHNWSTDVDSRLGGQVTARATSQLSAVVQVVAEQQYDDTYRPEVEWANLKYEITPDFSLRAGRTVLPTFMFSDTRKVGYANPWVRPPIEVYRLIPVAHSDGVDLFYALHSGPIAHRLTATYGKSEQRLPSSFGGDASARHLWVITDTIEYGAASVHLAYQRGRISAPAVSPLFAAFRNFGPEGEAIAARYDAVDKLGTSIGLGAQYDPGSWFAVAEWSHVQFHSVFGDSTGWYATAGYRLAKFTPYATFSEVSADSNTTDPGLNLANIPPPLQMTVFGLNAGLNTLLADIARQKTFSVGTRWDFYRNFDLKLQFDHTRMGEGSSGSLVNRQPDYRPGGTLNLLSITIEVVL